MTTVVPPGADRRAVAGLHPGRPDLLDRGRPDPADGLDGVAELGLVDLEVAAHDRGHQPAVAGHEEGGLGRPLRADAEEGRQRRDRRRAGRGDLLERERRLAGRCRFGHHRDLAVRGVVARLAQDEDVLAGRVEDHELVGLAAAHDPDVGGDHDGLETEPLEGPDVRAVLRLVAGVETGLVAVGAVGVLHDELADPDEPATGARLVPPLRLEVVDLLRQLPPRLDDVGQQQADDLLVGHRQDHVPPVAVLEAGQLGADRVVAAARAPDVGRVDDRHLHLLPADPVLLLADDLLDAVVDALAERQQRSRSRIRAGGRSPREAAGGATASRHRRGRRGGS